MNDLVAQLLTGAVGGGIITGIIGPAVLNSQERRKARAKVLEAIYQVEIARWMSTNNSFDKFRSSIVELRAIALIAKVNQDLLDHYVYMATVGMYASMDSFEEFGNDEEAGGGYIPTTLADGIRQAADELLKLLWHPTIGKLFVRKRLKLLRVQQKRLQKTVTRLVDKEPINWDVRV